MFACVYPVGDRILTPTPFGNVHKKSNKTIFGHLVKTIPRATRKLARTYLKAAAAPSLCNVCSNKGPMEGSNNLTQAFRLLIETEVGEGSKKTFYIGVKN